MESPDDHWDSTSGCSRSAIADRENDTQVRAAVLEPCTTNGPDAARTACGCRTRCRRPGAISVALVLSAAIALAYAAFERIGTRANADSIEFTPNLGAGFLAVGLTADEPGFVVLSEIDREKAVVSAELVSSVAAGTHTRVEIRTPQQQWQARLRSPLVIIVGKDGAVTAHAVDWGLDDFTRIRTAADCSHAAKAGAPRCGAPFADLHDLVSAGQLARVPDEVRTFLARFKQD